MAKRVGSQSDQPFIKLYRELTYRWTPWEVWQDFVTMFACSISNAVEKLHFDDREAMYLKRIQKYNAKEQEIFPQLAAEVVLALEKNPEQDFLGKIFMELGLSNDSGGQFFTPYNVCQMMAEMTISNVVPQVKERGYITINDPACGAGATLIAGVHAAAKPLMKTGFNWQNHILVTAQDITGILDAGQLAKQLRAFVPENQLCRISIAVEVVEPEPSATEPATVESA